MNVIRRARPILLALVILMGLMGPANAADAQASTEDTDTTVATDSDSGDVVADESEPAIKEGWALSVPSDDGLDLSEQQFDDLDMDLIDSMRNEPEAIPATKKKGIETLDNGLLAQGTCSPTCDGQDPVAMGCDDGAVIREYVETVEETRFYVQLRFSSKCGSVWSRARFIEGNAGRVMALETREFRTESEGKQNPVATSNNVLVSGFSNGWVWTTMFNAPSFPNVRACSQPSVDTGRDDFLQCSRPGYTSLISARGLCLDVPFRNFASGQRVWIYDCHGFANLAQMWQIRPDGTIRTGGLNGNVLCLRIDRARAGNAIPLVLAECRNWGSMKWQYKPSGQIVNTSQGTRCVDVPNGTSERMTYVQVWQCMIYTGSNQPIGAQRWRSPSTAYLDGLY